MKIVNTFNALPKQSEIWPNKDWHGWPARVLKNRDINGVFYTFQLKSDIGWWEGLGDYETVLEATEEAKRCANAFAQDAYLSKISGGVL